MEAWQKLKLKHDQSRQQLESLRQTYNTGKDAERQKLAKQILQQEVECERMEGNLKKEAKEIRNTEIQYLKK